MFITNAMRVLQARTARRGCGSCRPKPPATPRRMQRRPLPSERTAGESPSVQCSRDLWPCIGAISSSFASVLPLVIALASKLGRSPRSSSSCVPYLPMQLGLLVNVAVRRGHADSLASVGVNPNGSRFVSGGWDGAIHVWRTGAQSCCRVIVAWSPADALLIIALAVTCRQTARGSGLSRSQAVAPSKRLSEEERSERPVYLAWQGGQSWTRQRRRKRRARQTTPLAAARGVLRAAALQMALPVMAAA